MPGLRDDVSEDEIVEWLATILAVLTTRTDLNREQLHRTLQNFAVYSILRTSYFQAVDGTTPMRGGSACEKSRTHAGPRGRRLPIEMRGAATMTVELRGGM